MSLQQLWIVALPLILAAPASAQPLPASLPVHQKTQAQEQEPSSELESVRSPLSLRVVYPGPDDRVRVRDSSFLLGSVSGGDVQLTINGSNVRVWPNGAWLAWVPFPPDSVMEFRIEARRQGDTIVVMHPVRRDLRYVAAEIGLGSTWVDTMSLTPRGQVWVPASEYVTLSARAVEAATVRVHLPNGSVVRLLPQRQPEEVLPAIRAFERDTTKLRTPDEVRYVGVIRGTSFGPDPGPLLRGHAPSVVRALARAALRCVTGARCPTPYAELLAPDEGWAMVEVATVRDTIRARWPLQLALMDTLPVVAEFDDDSTGLGQTDSLTPGRPTPGGAYEWFFPTGTRALVTARVNDDVRIRLSPEAEAWVPVADARPLPAGLPAPHAVVGSVTLAPAENRVAIRIPLTQRIPFQVAEDERRLTLRLYGAVGDVDWLRYSGDSLIRRLSWSQSGSDELTFSVELSEAVWGYRTRWSQNDLILEIRRPPRLSITDPLRGRVIALDPGHPPLGATGPTGLREADANLAVALRLRAMLQAAGARVVMTRTADTAVELWSRLATADTSGAELLVSIHNNALPDGVNPFTNNGTSVFYNLPRSLPLAAEIQHSLVRRLGLPDLGVGRADLAVVRSTWMPSVLCEGMFLIMPDQESRLRSPRGQAQYARAVLEGIQRFLRDRARRRLSTPVGRPGPRASPRANSIPSLREAAGAGPERSVDP